MPALTLHHRHWPAGLPLTLEYPRRTLFANLALSAQADPHAILNHFYGGALSYGRALEEVVRLAGFLQQACGVRKGDRVLLYMQNSPQFMLAYYAILRADAVVVPINPMLLGDELEHVCTDSGARVAMLAQELVAHTTTCGLTHLIVATYSDYVGSPPDPCAPPQALAPRGWATPDYPAGKVPVVTAWADALAAAHAPAPHRAGPDDHALLPYSSGTTGRPKGCVHPHRTFQSTAHMSARWGEISDHPVVLASLPMFHVTGMQAGMNIPILLGIPVVVMVRWDREAAAALIKTHRVTSWTCITTMAIDLLSHPRVAEFDLSSLTRIGGGGAPMPAAVAEKLKALTGLDYIEGYGLTETAAPSHMNPTEHPKKQCGGIPAPDTDARVIDPATFKELGPHESGEIVVSGPQVFDGYWNNPQATAEVFFELDGKRFFRTGDIGHYDEDGYFFITDRLKRMINAAGFKVWPAEIESMMYAHPDIQEACVVAARDPRRGETVKAYVVLKQASRGRTSGEAILQWCRDHMAAYKAPRLVEFVDALPRSGTGKVLWRVLQDEENRRQ